MEGFPTGSCSKPKSIEEMFFGENIDPVYQSKEMIFIIFLNMVPIHLLKIKKVSV